MVTTIPRETAAHFCQLMVCDNEGNVTPISSFVGSHQLAVSDNITAEQLFASYVFQHDGWQTLRVFPHSDGNGVTWYAATDELPARLGSEHQKYIRDVLHRMTAEVEAANWTTVDAYIERLSRYQVTFAAPEREQAPTAVATPLVGLLLLLFLTIPILKNALSRKKA